MTKKEAIKYLKEIIKKWRRWEKHHRKLCQAIEVILEDEKRRMGE